MQERSENHETKKSGLGRFCIDTLSRS